MLSKTNCIVVTCLSMLSFTSAQSNLRDILSNNPATSILLERLQETNLLDWASNFSDLTFLAPTNDAFSYFNQTNGTHQVQNFTAILQYHMIPANVPSTDIPGGEGVFLPTALSNDEYELVPGGQIIQLIRNTYNQFFIRQSTRNQIMLVRTDITYNNGRIHLVDRIADPPVSLGDDPPATNWGTGQFHQQSVNTPAQEVLDTRPNITIFAFDNNAWVGSHLAPTRDELLDIIEYHIVPGRYFFSDLTDGLSLQTVQGTEIRIADGMLNNASILDRNIIVKNGVLHTVDQVLLPKARDQYDSVSPPSGAAGLKAGKGALIAAVTLAIALLIR